MRNLCASEEPNVSLLVALKPVEYNYRVVLDINLRGLALGSVTASILYVLNLINLMHILKQCIH